MKKCDICGGKAGFLMVWKLKDGVFCSKCFNAFDSIGFTADQTWYPEDYTQNEAKSMLKNPFQWKNEVSYRTEQRRKRNETLKKLNEYCLTCGKETRWTDQCWQTSDGRVLCVRCAMAAMTVSPQEYMKNKNHYIEMHDSSFFLKNMNHVEHPHPDLSVNFTRKCFYYRSFFTDINNVFSFESVVKFETDVNKYEVTVGKKGHPIARAVAGGVMFGTAGAIVGAMTTKNTHRKEVYTGDRYVDIYYKDASQQSGINKRRLASADELVIVRLEECLKRVFEVNDEDMKNNNGMQVETTSIEYEKLIELKKLLEMDIITQEEFNQKKKEILNL